MHRKELADAKANVASVPSNKFSAKSRSLKNSQKNSRRGLLKDVREEVEFEIDSEHKLKHPVLRERVDPRKVEAISRSVDRRSGHFSKKRDRSRRHYSLAGGLFLSVLASSFVFYAVLVWIGAL